MPKRASTRQKTRRSLQGRATTEGRLGKRPAPAQRVNRKKQRKGQPRLKAGE